MAVEASDCRIGLESPPPTNHAAAISEASRARLSRAAVRGQTGGFCLYTDVLLDAQVTAWARRGEKRIEASF